MSTIPSIATRFTQRFGVRHPFACAGMAFAGLTPDLAIAVSKAGERVKGSVLASDAFFPFRDSVDEAAKAGAVAVIQPGGSVRDKEVIAAADAAGIAMVFTGIRHFRH